MLDNFVNVSGMLQCGVYVLRHHGKVVYVGKAARGMLLRIATHRSLARKTVPAWLPVKGIVFDEILIQVVHPDRLDDIHDELVDHFQPRYNLPSPFVMAAQQIELVRRI